MLFSGKTGTLFFEWHRQVGEFVLALLLFRLIWGFVGSSNARLLPLMVSPRVALSHLRQLAQRRVKAERGHNAAGGWAVLLMLALLIFQAVSGIFIADEEELLEGRFYGVLSSSTTQQLLELHELNSGFLITFVIVHVLMILLYKLRAGQNLILPMITGKMQWPDSEKLPDYTAQRWWVGLLLLVLVFSLAFWVFKWL